MWSAVFPILVIASAVLMSGAAAAPQSPACALLNEEEAIRAVSGSLLVSDGGPATKGYSDCAWSNAGGGAVMSLIFWAPDFFEAGGKSAEAHYNGLAAALKRRNLPIEAMSGLGERALMLDEGSPGLAAYTLIVLQGGAVAQLTQRGVGRSQTLDAAQAIAGRMGEAGAAVPPPPPPVAARGPAASSACDLLKAADLPWPGFSMEDGGPAANGESACNWQEPARNADISVVLRLHGPEPFTVLPEAESGDADPVSGIGQEAYLESSGVGENASFDLTVLMNGNIAVLSTFRVDRASVLKLGGTIAGRM